MSLTINLDVRTANEIGLFEFLKSKGFKAEEPPSQSVTTPDIEKLQKLITHWRGEVIRWHDAGFFMRSDTFADCANELEIALEEEELPPEKQKGIRGVICD